MNPSPQPVLQVALLGECMLELRGTAFGAMQQGFGGDTLNTAVYMARCAPAGRLSVGYATGLGTDGFSDGLVARWQAEGVHTRWVRRVADAMPGLYLIEVDPGGERRFSYWRGQSAAKRLFDGTGREAIEAEAAQLALLHVSGISLAILPPAGRQRLLALMAAVRRAGGRVSFDNNYRPRLWASADEALALFEQALAQADIGLITLDDEIELRGLVGEGAQAAATAAVAALPTPELVLKRGAHSTRVAGPTRQWCEVPVQPVQPVDTTAAGDSFAAGYLVRRLLGDAPAVAAAFGNQLAARVIAHPGALIPRAAMADLMPG